MGAVGLIPRGDIDTQNQAQVGDQVGMVASVGQRMQKLLTTNDLAGILRLKPIQE